MFKNRILNFSLLTPISRKIMFCPQYYSRVVFFSCFLFWKYSFDVLVWFLTPFSRNVSEIFMRCSGLSYNPFLQKCFLQKCFWNIHEMFWSELKNPFSINVFSRYISEIFMRCSGLSYNPFIQKCFLQKCFWNIHAMFWSELKTLFSRNGFLFPCFRPLSLPISTLLAMLTYRDLQLSIQNTTKHFNTSQNLNTLLIII